MVDAGIFGDNDRKETFTQWPVALDSLSEPEPDVVVVRGGPRAYRSQPTSPVLLVEVGDTSLAFDGDLDA